MIAACQSTTHAILPQDWGVSPALAAGKVPATSKARSKTQQTYIFWHIGGEAHARLQNNLNRSLVRRDMRLQNESERLKNLPNLLCEMRRAWCCTLLCLLQHNSFGVHGSASFFAFFLQCAYFCTVMIPVLVMVLLYLIMQGERYWLPQACYWRQAGQYRGGLLPSSGCSSSTHFLLQAALRQVCSPTFLRSRVGQFMQLRPWPWPLPTRSG